MKKQPVSILLVLALCLGLTAAALASGETAEEAVGKPTSAEETVAEAAPEEEPAREEEPALIGESAPAEEAHAEETVGGSEPALDGDLPKCGDDLTYSMTVDGTLTISGTGPMYDNPVWPKPTRIKEVVIEDGVTGIGKALSSIVQI